MCGFKIKFSPAILIFLKFFFCWVFIRQIHQKFKVHQRIVSLNFRISSQNFDFIVILSSWLYRFQHKSLSRAFQELFRNSNFHILITHTRPARKTSNKRYQSRHSTPFLGTLNIQSQVLRVVLDRLRDLLLVSVGALKRLSWSSSIHP